MSSWKFEDLVAEADEREAEARVVFHKYDLDGDGVISRDELPFCLAALGAFDGLDDTDVEEVVEREFKRIDANEDGELSFDEFASFYNASKRRQHVLDTRELKDIFYCLCSFKTFKRRDNLKIQEGDWLTLRMNKEVFKKMAEGLGVMSEGFGLKQLGQVYKESVPFGEMKLGYHQFLDAMALLAETKGVPMQELCKRTLVLGGHKEEDVDKLAPKPKTPYEGKYSADSAQLAAAEHLDVDEEVITGMRNLFERFCRFGEAEGSYSVDEMRDFIFLKLCRDCNLLDSRVTEKGAKKIFVENTPARELSMSFMHFYRAVCQMAELKGKPATDLMTYLAHLKITDGAQEGEATAAEAA